ncbi:MAG: TolC family protein [Treponema sp.]|nr:TolC family protein [Treponema sp.]
MKNNRKTYNRFYDFGLMNKRFLKGFIFSSFLVIRFLCGSEEVAAVEKNLFQDFTLIEESKKDLIQDLKSEEEKSVLESLWELLLINNVEISNANYKEKISEHGVSDYWLTYVPSLSVETASTLTGFFNEENLFPNVLTGSFSLNENLPGGLSLNLAQRVSCSKYLKDYKKKENYSNVKYVDVANLSLGLYKTLGTNFIQKGFVDSGKKEKILISEMDKVSTKSVIQSKVEDFTNNFINFRQYCRNIESIGKSINLYYELFEGSKDLLENHSISWKEYYEIEETICELENNLWEIKKNKEESFVYLVNLLGLENDFSEEDFEELAFEGKTFPDEVRKMFYKNPIMEYCDLQEELTKTSFELNKQNLAPVVGLSLELPVHDGNDYSYLEELTGNPSKQWSVGFVVNLSPVFLLNKKRMDEEYFEAMKNYQNQRANYEIVLSREAETYRKMVAFYKNQLNNLEKVYENKVAFFDSIKTLYEKGQCSYLELLQAEIGSIGKKYLMEDFEDLIWLYEWMVKNRTTDCDSF